MTIVTQGYGGDGFGSPIVSQGYGYGFEFTPDIEDITAIIPGVVYIDRQHNCSAYIDQIKTNDLQIDQIKSRTLTIEQQKSSSIYIKRQLDKNLEL